VVPEVPATGEPGTDSFPPFPPDSLVLRTLVLRMSDLIALLRPLLPNLRTDS